MSETSRLRGGEGYGVRDDVVTLRHARGLRASFCHAAAAARRAASLRLGLKTGLLRSPSVFRPRSGPSALLRTPSRFLVHAALQDFVIFNISESGQKSEFL